MISMVRGDCVLLLSACLMHAVAMAQPDAPTKAAPSTSCGEVNDMESRERVNQLDLSGDVQWKDQLQRLILDARFVTGKDMVALDKLFPDEPLTGKDKRSDVDLYLVIRLQTRERLSYFPGPLTVKMIADDDWPFSEASLPDAVEIPSMGTKVGVVYYIKHLWGAAEGSRIKDNKVLTSKRWKFRVVEAHFK